MTYPTNRWTKQLLAPEGVNQTMYVIVMSVILTREISRQPFHR